MIVTIQDSVSHNIVCGWYMSGGFIFYHSSLTVVVTIVRNGTMETVLE